MEREIKNAISRIIELLFEFLAIKIKSHNRKLKGQIVRETEHEGSALLVRDEAPQFSLGLLDGLLVFSAHGGVLLHHFHDYYNEKKWIQLSSRRDQNDFKKKTKNMIGV